MEPKVEYESDTRPEQVFDPWAGQVVESWADLNKRIDNILAVHGGEPLYWRGVTDASFGLYSSLYRRLKMSRARVNEDMMIEEERRLLERARMEWRLDNMSALEIFAHVQHYGGPTRLIDVTKNPLVAAWFAVEEQRLSDGSAAKSTDARMFCFYAGEHIQLDQTWDARDPIWFGWATAKERRAAGWGDGTNRRVWVPPAYNSRISAQNAAFIVDGVPYSYGGSNSFTMGPGQFNKRWHIGPVRDASSIPLKLNDSARAKQTENSTPAFTFRIAATAVPAIRARLESNYGFSVSSLYSDLYGLAAKAAPHLPT